MESYSGSKRKTLLNDSRFVPSRLKLDFQQTKEDLIFKILTTNHDFSEVEHTQAERDILASMELCIVPPFFKFPFGAEWNWNELSVEFHQSRTMKHCFPMFP